MCVFNILKCVVDCIITHGSKLLSLEECKDKKKKVFSLGLPLGDENKTINSIKHKLIESQACVRVFRLALMEFPRSANWVKGHLFSCCCSGTDGWDHWRWWTSTYTTLKSSLHRTLSVRVVCVASFLTKCLPRPRNNTKVWNTGRLCLNITSSEAAVLVKRWSLSGSIFNTAGVLIVSTTEKQTACPESMQYWEKQ